MACRNGLDLQKILLKNVLYGRFFIFVLLLSFSSFSYAEIRQSKLCVSTHYDEQQEISYVIDGDTVVLKDKRHIRLIGINTPEISHNGSVSESGADTARNRLIEILDETPAVFLQFDNEKQDRHGRTLAHLFLKNGANVQALMLTEGLAMPLAIPPNLSFLDCYVQSSKFARNERLGLWAMLHYQPKDVNRLSGNEKGFMFIRGKILQISDSRSSLWINMENNFALRILKQDLHYFDEKALFGLENTLIEASGWIYKRNGQLRMRIRHPQDFFVITQ